MGKDGGVNTLWSQLGERRRQETEKRSPPASCLLSCPRGCRGHPQVLPSHHLWWRKQLCFLLMFQQLCCAAPPWDLPPSLPSSPPSSLLPLRASLDLCSPSSAHSACLSKLSLRLSFLGNPTLSLSFSFLFYKIKLMISHAGLLAGLNDTMCIKHQA